MGVMLEKWPNKGQEYLKYMFNVRLAASRGSGTGWAAYDEQYRLRKARYPHTLKFQQDRNPRWVLPFWL
jgi:hypothetical protein